MTRITPYMARPPPRRTTDSERRQGDAINPESPWPAVLPDQTGQGTLTANASWPITNLLIIGGQRVLAKKSPAGPQSCRTEPAGAP